MSVLRSPILLQLVMPFLVAAVIIVGILCALDIVLTFGVIRRLREHTELLAVHRRSAEPPVIKLASGQMPTPFAALTTDGREMTGPDGLRLAGFFASGCPTCPGRVAPFIEYVRAHQIRRDQVLAVLLPGDDGPPAYLGQLAEIAELSVQDGDDAITRAFGVSGYPAFCLLDEDGAVVASAFDPAALPATQATARAHE
jgi:hypothetical protein